jgi:hypothetical protein
MTVISKDLRRIEHHKSLFFWLPPSNKIQYKRATSSSLFDMKCSLILFENVPFSPAWIIYYTDKKENQIFLIYKEIQRGAVATLYMKSASSYTVWGNICAFPHILGSPSSYMTLQLIHSEFPYILGKFDFLFYQCIKKISLFFLFFLKLFYRRIANALYCICAIFVVVGFSIVRLPFRA